MFSLNHLQNARLRNMFGLVVMIALGLGLILFALKQNINLYLTPSEIQTKFSELEQQKVFRLGGLVVAGSHLETNDLHHEFVLTDGIQNIKVKYQGLLPDLFREKQGIVTQGHLENKKLFIAEQVLAKHDENYHPPGLPKDSLA